MTVLTYFGAWPRRAKTFDYNCELEFESPRYYKATCIVFGRGTNMSSQLSRRLVRQAMSALSFFGLTLLTPAVANSTKSPSPFSVPATFTGEAPCLDCRGNIAVTLTLRPDGTFADRDAYRYGGWSTWSGTWRYEFSSNALILSGRAGQQSYYRVTGAKTLEPLDYKGDPMGRPRSWPLDRPEKPRTRRGSKA